MSTHDIGDDDLLLADMSAALGVLSEAVEAKDPYTAAHADEVAELAARVARRIGLTGESLRAVRHAALLHDVGKVGVRSELITKPGKLEPHERTEMERHSEIGARMLERIPFFADVVPLVRGTHERWDGRGYPDGLASEEIPVGARVVSACDAWHAMTSDRPYRRAMDEEEAMAELRRCAGTQFDEDVVDALLQELTASEAGERPSRIAAA